jgi:AraC family transcriptional activator of pobA
VPFYVRAETLLQLLADCQAGAADAYTGRTLHALLTALLSLVAGQLAPDPARPRPPETRGQLLARAFEKLLHQHYGQWKQPGQYAAALAITGAHLNDTVKEHTGLSVSTHLQQRAVLEAKRLLYTTTRSVQEIGYALGYEEPGYFGKLFKKVTGLTPQQFRRQFRE